MDSLTHLCTGALVGEALIGKKYGTLGMLLGALASSLPDIDVVANLFFDPGTAAVLHRGLTHSLVFAVAASAGLARIFRQPFRRYDIGTRQGFRFFLVAILVHIGLDICNCYGTGLFEPFSRMRVTWNILFVADPLFSLPFVAATAALLFIRRQKARYRITRTALAAGVIYMMLAAAFKIHIHRKAGHEMRKQDLVVENYLTTPAPLNIFLWHVVARTERGNYTGYMSLFDRQDSMTFSYVPRNELVLILFRKDRKIDRLKWLSEGYYCFTRYDGKVYFNDIRFGRVAGWMRGDSRFVFSYSIAQHDATVSVIQRTDFDMPASVAFKGLLKRIRGMPPPEG